MSWEQSVRRRLLALHKTQRQLADALNYSASYVCDMLHGRVSPALRTEIDHVLDQWEQQARQKKETERRRRRWL